MKLLGLMLEIIGEGIESVIKYIGARFFFFRIDYFQRGEDKEEENAKISIEFICRVTKQLEMEMGRD